MGNGRVKVISDTIQEFNGERFYLCGRYFQHKGRRLHRAVWSEYYGHIPDGYHIHHKDGDSHNNQIENLDLITEEEHYKHHATTEARRANGRRAILLAIEKAKDWHHSEEGIKWHSDHRKKAWENAPLNTYVCTYCGKEYQSRAVRHNGNHFCCNNHKAAYRRQRIREERTCESRALNQ